MNLKRLEAAVQRLARNQAEARTATRFAQWAGKPCEYVREHLDRGLTPKQAEILTKLDQPPYRVLARSANTQGKTFVAAAKCSHFYDTVRPSITLATAPTRNQVRDLLFAELRNLRPTPAGFAPKDTRLQASHKHYVHGLTAAKADAFQGRHAPNLGLVFDEATGIDPDFWGRGETMFESHGGHWWLATFNPNDSSSVVYSKEEAGTWHIVVLSALEHPNILAELRGGPPPIPGAIRLATVLRRMSEECEEVAGGREDAAIDFEFPAGSGIWWHPLTPDFEAQVLGRWPVSPTQALFSPQMIEAAYDNARAVSPKWQVQIGCDVARFGDDKTCIAARVGPSLVKLETYSRVSTTWIAERLRGVAREIFSSLSLDKDASTNIPVLIDDTGGYGAGVIDQASGHNFIGINAASASVDPRYYNTRSHMWCELAALAAGGALDFSRLPLNDRLNVKQELTAARFDISSTIGLRAGTRRVEPKSQIKERLKRSPDRADAICLAYHMAAACDAL